MTAKNNYSLCAIVAGVLLAFMVNLPTPASAYRRSCHFVVELNPEGERLEPVIYSFRVYGTTERYTRVNDLRRSIRSSVTTCLQSHWANRDAESPPASCTDLADTFEMQECPFSEMAEQFRDDICDANLEEQRLTVDIEVFIRGKRGCLERDEERGVVDPAAYVVIAPDYNITCPIGDSGSWGTYFRPPLPNTRLPGMDILPWIALEGDQDWRACDEHCENTAGCEAWTLRGAGTSGPSRPEPQCILKSGTPQAVEDDCCQSGIME